MRRAPLVAAALLVTALTACSTETDQDAAPARHGKLPTRHVPEPPRHARPRGPLPRDLLIADRDNNRVLIVTPSKRIVWQAANLRGPDDAFFTPGGRSILTNEEFNDTLTQVSIATKRRVWRYGHDAVAGSSPGYLNTPDDAYRLRSGATTVADIRNCRIVEISRARRVARILGGSCVHDPPRGFASPNGDTPLPDGGLLVTEIGPPGWIDRLDARGRLVWSLRSPVAYPSDAQLLPDGRILVASFTVPGKIVILDRSGRVRWSFGAAHGPNMLAKPSLAIRLPNGLIAANDDYNHRVVVVDPGRRRIVWQYGRTGVAGSGPGYLNKPDGIDLAPPSFSPPRARVSRRSAASSSFVRVGSLPAPVSRASAVALPAGQLLVLGGLVGGGSTSDVLLGTPGRLRRAGSLPQPTHDAAAARLGGSVYLFGGGQAASTDAIVRVDPRTGAARRAGSLGEPLSDLGAATVGGSVYLVGGYTGSRYATGILRLRRPGSVRLVARLPVGLRYAGVATVGRTVYVAGGVTTGGTSDAIFAFDTRTHAVRRLGRLPTPVSHAALAAVGGALDLVGGRSANGAPLRQVLRIDPKTGGVRRAATLPQPLADAAAVDVGGHLFVIGGGTDGILRLEP